MSKRLVVSLILLSSTALVSCAPNIAELAITERDMKTYENPFLTDAEKNLQTTTIRVAIVPAERIKNRERKKVSNLFRAELDSAISKLHDFEVVPRSEISSVMRERELQSMLSNKRTRTRFRNVDFLLVYKVLDYGITEDTSVSISDTMKLFSPYINSSTKSPPQQANMRVKLTLVNLREGIKEFTKTFSGNSSQGSNGSSLLYPAAALAAANNFVKEFALDYSPPGYVIQTKGQGKVALISLGANFGLEKSTKVEFFFYKQKGKKKIVVPFAYGSVLEVNTNDAWVEISNYENAKVMENHFVHVRKNQSNGILDKLPGLRL